MAHHSGEPTEGRTLGEVVSVHGPRTTGIVRTMAIDLLRELVAAHEAGIVHGAISPETVRLTDGGKAVLTGFGTSADDQAYRAPERDQEQRALPPGDVFSLGATLHFALNGAPPSTSRAAAEDIGELESLIAQLLAVDPSRRKTAAEALALLERPRAYSLAPVVSLVLTLGVLIAIVIGLGQSESSSDEESDSSVESTYSDEETTDYDDETSDEETSDEETTDDESSDDETTDEETTDEETSETTETTSDYDSTE